MITKKTSLIILTGIIILINFYSINCYPISLVRPLRFASSLALFSVFLLFGGLIKIKLTMAFLFLCLTDLLIMNYDDKIYNNLTSIPKSIAYIFIGFHLISKFKIEVESKRILFIYLFIIGFCGIMFYELVDTMTLTFEGALHKYLYLCYALVLLFVLILVWNYNFRYNSIQSISCMLFMFAFAISDLFAFIAYYLDVNSFYYPTRLFYILGLGLFTAYAVLPFQKEELFIDDTSE